MSTTTASTTFDPCSWTDCRGRSSKSIADPNGSASRMRPARPSCSLWRRRKRAAWRATWPSPPAHHALVIAAHSWAHRPLRRILDLVDVELLAAAGSPQEVTRVASRWNLSRLWRTTADVADALIMGGGRPPLELRSWGRALVEVRDITVFENHVVRFLSPFSVLPVPRALGACATALLDEVRPVPDEPWRNKLYRMRVELAHPTRAASEQARMLGPDHALDARSDKRRRRPHAESPRQGAESDLHLRARRRQCLR